MPSQELSAGAMRAAAFLEHPYQEALAMVQENKHVVLALAQALVDDPSADLERRRN
ncbi:MAG: hypothetical protein ACXWKP_33450 [Bradyrhizobium sp.]